MFGELEPTHENALNNQPGDVLQLTDSSVCLQPQEVQEVASALRTALWGKHAVMALLPSQGNAPLEVTDAFRRGKATANGDFSEIVKAGSASVLVAPASAARGLDFVLCQFDNGRRKNRAKKSICRALRRHHSPL